VPVDDHVHLVFSMQACMFVCIYAWEMLHTWASTDACVHVSETG